MHKSVLSFVSAKVENKNNEIKVLEFGSRDINGTPRALFPKADYYGLDVEPGKGVDEVVKFGQKLNFNEAEFDTVLYLETSQIDPQINFQIEEFRRVLKPGGILIISARSKTFPEIFMGRKPKRYDSGEILGMLGGFENVEAIPDPELPGWLVFAQKPCEVESEEEEEEETKGKRGRPRKG